MSTIPAEQGTALRPTEQVTTTNPNVKPGTGFIIIRSIDAKISDDSILNPKMLPYCKIKLGWHRTKTEVSSLNGPSIKWPDVVLLQRKHGEKSAKLKIKDKEKFPGNNMIAAVVISLEEVVAKGRSTQTFNLEKKHRVVGEITVDLEYNQNL